MADDHRALAQRIDLPPYRRLPFGITRIVLFGHARVAHLVSGAEITPEAIDQLVIPRVVDIVPTSALNEEDLRHAGGRSALRSYRGPVVPLLLPPALLPPPLLEPLPLDALPTPVPAFFLSLPRVAPALAMTLTSWI